jgi:hypothetical protein
VVDQVKAVLLERDEVLAAANSDLQKARAALVEAQTVAVEKEMALASRRPNFNRITPPLRGHDPGRSKPSRRPRRPRGWGLT